MDERRAVLITRPEPGLSASATRLQNMGYSPIKMPLNQIKQITFIMPEFNMADGVMFTSKNAVAAFAQQNTNEKLAVPAFCVGEQTTKAAQELGFEVAITAPDAKTLASSLIAVLPSKSRLIYFCGTERKPNLEMELNAAEHIIMVIEVYTTLSTPRENIFNILLQHQSCEAALLYAPSAARALSQIIEKRADLVSSLENTKLLCLSRDVEMALTSDLRANSFAADQPNEQSLFALLANRG